MDPKLTRLLETNIDFDKANPKIAIYKSRLQNNTYSRNRQIRNKDIGNLRRISRVFKKKYSENEKANYLSGIADYIEELPETVEESRNKGLSLLAEPAQAKLEFPKSRIEVEKAPQLKLKEDTEEICEIETNNITEITTKYKYDPEFGNQISDRKSMILILKKALKDLEDEERKLKMQGLELYEAPKNLYELLVNFVLNPKIEISTILSVQFKKDTKQWSTTRSRTSLFEGLWTIVVGLGFLSDRFQIENIQLVDWTKVNKEALPSEYKSQSNATKDENILNILKKLNFGTSASGVSDITFFYNEKNNGENKLYKTGCSIDNCKPKEDISKVYISSVKFFELDIKKNIDKFDIAPLIAASEILTKDKRDYEILLFIKDKKAVSNIVEQARKKYLTNKIASYNIFGETDLLSSLFLLRDRVLSQVKGDIPETIKSLYGKEESPKSFLSLRFHQELIVEKVNNYVITTKDTKKTALIGVLPRGGKTYICGGIIAKLQPKNVLVLTHVPRETNKQFLDDLFHKFADFSDYEVKYLKETSNDDYDPAKKYIIFTSYQLYKKGVSQTRESAEVKRKLLKKLIDKELVPDLCFLDEAHFGSAGQEAQEIYNEFNEKTIRILMTATYINPYRLFTIQPNQLFTWDYEDIQLGKSLSDGDTFLKFKIRHLLQGETEASNDTIFDKVIQSQRSKGNNINDIQEIYSKFPNIEIINTSFEEKAKEAFEAQLLDDGSRGFSMESILAINSKTSIPAKISDAYNLFENPAIVGKFLNYIQPRISDLYMKELPLQNGTLKVDHIEGNLERFNIMDRIYLDSQVNGSRLKRDVPHTQIWFIPPSNGIRKRIFALASMLLRHPWFSNNFCILGISGGELDKQMAQKGEDLEIKTVSSFSDGKCVNLSCAGSNDLKECIENEERKARCDQKKGTIILTGFMLRMGISLGCADVVMLLDDDTHPDSTIQKMFRALTESEGKKKSYVVDLNPRRSIKAICDHIQGIKQTIDRKCNNVYQTVITVFGINSDRFLFGSPGGKPINYQSLLEDISKEYETAKQPKDISDLEKKATDLLASFREPEVQVIIENDFKLSYLAGQDFKKQREMTRRAVNENNNGLGGSGKTRVKKQENNKDDANNEDNENDMNDEELTRMAPPAPRTYPEKLENFKIILDTTLKLIAFTQEGEEGLINPKKNLENKEIQNLIYDTLISRGLVNEVMLVGHKRDNKGIIAPKLNSEEKILFNKINEEQKTYVISDILKTFNNLIGKKTNLTYREMKRQVNDKSVDQQKILKYIEDNLAPTVVLKDEFGAVFTPMRLVNEMLDNLKLSEPNIFKDKNNKWLDPANGIGNFPVAVFYRLMQEVEGISRNPEERANYIIKNMLYMVEIQPANSAKCRRIFKKLAPDVEPNILTANTLTEFIVNKNFKDGTKEFDIIIGNPPYNPPKTETGSSGNNIWPNFVMKSFSLLKKNGYLCFLHPPGWKKPTDEIYKPEKFKGGDFSLGLIRVGQVWKVLKETGSFKYIYTNDQLFTRINEYLPYFPAVDYYIYHKDEENLKCNTKNVFLGMVIETKDVKLNYKLKYLPNLITKQTQDILFNVTSKEGDKPIFKAGFDPRGFETKEKGEIKYLYDASVKGPNYAYHNEKIPNVDMSKVVLNENGGFNGFYCKFIEESEKIGVLHHTLFYQVNSKQGKNIEKYFNSDIVKFIFLITQYIPSGKNPTNEKLVANSLTIPPEGTEDYYKFFGIEQYKEYIEDLLNKYRELKAPKRGTRAKKRDARHRTRKLHRFF